MSLIAGIDIGNATTEVVIVDTSATPPRALAHDRAPTRGRKGSDGSVRAALALLHRLERRSGITADVLAMAPQFPVDTRGARVAAPLPATGRLAVLGSGRSTPAGRGVGVGRPVSVDAEPQTGSVVLVASDPLGYEHTAARVRAWRAAGADVVGILLAGDEAVLVSRRVGGDLPVLDQVNADTALQADLIALEVAADGTSASALTDAVQLASLLGLEVTEHAHAEAVARRARGARDVAFALFHSPPAAPESDAATGWVELADGTRVPLLDALPLLHADRAVVRCALPSTSTGASELVVYDVDDLWGVDLTSLAADALARPGSVHEHAVALALLGVSGQAGHRTSMHDEAATHLTFPDPRELIITADEATAARVGALSTPGVSPEATVVDIGAGTIDVIGLDGGARVLAGAGDLITVATATLLGITRGQAEWAKRGPARRIEGPHLAVDEAGQRHFLDTPAAPSTIGWLVAPGPAGPLPFDRSLSPSEWRALRLRLKQAVLGRGIARGLHGRTAGEVIVVGGPAGDSEVLDCVALALPGTIPGRGNVAGTLGHRWAVALGLTLIASGAPKYAPSAHFSPTTPPTIND